MLVELTIISKDIEDIEEEIEEMWKVASREIKDAMEAGQVVLDITGVEPLHVAIALACLHGLSGVFPFVRDDLMWELENGLPYDLHEYRNNMYLKHRDPYKKEK